MPGHDWPGGLEALRRLVGFGGIEYGSGSLATCNAPSAMRARHGVPLGVATGLSCNVTNVWVDCGVFLKNAVAQSNDTVRFRRAGGQGFRFGRLWSGRHNDTRRY